MAINWEWAYDGVNSSVPRNRGPACVNYLPFKRIIIESFIVIPFTLFLAKYGAAHLPTLNQINYKNSNRIVFGKQLLAIMMSSVLGLEMGFKLCTRSAIYILNPCHLTSMLQVYLLAAKPSKWTTTLFRIHLSYLNGPLLAFLFPEHESRKITFELPTYYIQHGLMFIIAIYLLRYGGSPFTPEKYTDFSYCILAYGAFMAYHFGILTALALNVGVNLNHMICPAMSDPFQGENYRIWALTHQALLFPIVTKSVAYLFSSTNTLTDDYTECAVNSKSILQTSSTNETNFTDRPNDRMSSMNDINEMAISANTQKNDTYDEIKKEFIDANEFKNNCDIEKQNSSNEMDSDFENGNKKLQ